MKLDNKGFAITAIIYSILVIVILIMTLVLAIIGSRRQTIEKIQERVKKEVTDKEIESNSNENQDKNKNVGDELCIGEECFYVLNYDGSKYTLFAKYNIYAGRIYNSESSYVNISTTDPLYGKQNSKAIGDKGSTIYPRYGTMTYNETVVAVANYANYIKNAYGINVTSRGINLNELVNTIGCTVGFTNNHGCDASVNSNVKYGWVTNTTYWTGATDGTKHYLVGGDGYFNALSEASLTNVNSRGARPVIVVAVSELTKIKDIIK